MVSSRVGAQFDSLGPLADFLSRWLEPADYAVGAWFFVRGVSLVFLLAFSSLLAQVDGLYGPQGILPFQPPMDGRWLKAACILGILFSLAAFWGWLEGLWLLLAWLIYFWFVRQGEVFLSFQWDALLLEAGFIALLVSPFRMGSFLTVPIPSAASLILIWVLLFKLMFLSGVVKLASGDPSWRDLTALTYHYWTQPLPNPVSWWMHQLPEAFHRVSCALMFLIELVFPFLIFINGTTRWIAFLGLAGLQLVLIATGNFAFFNWLSLALCFPLLSNSIYIKLWDGFVVGGASGWALSAVALMVAVPLVFTSLIWMVRPFYPRLFEISAVRQWLTWTFPLQLNSPYGLFAVMTKERPELEIEGSLNGKEWRAYRFRYKISDTRARLPWVAPHQPRLDWQMWFAALGPFEASPWLVQLMDRLARQQPEVLKLLADNPFPDEPPRFLRVRKRLFHPTHWGEEAARQGHYWQASEPMEFSPIFSRNPAP